MWQERSPRAVPGLIRGAEPRDLGEILSLIAEVGLPTAGIRAHVAHFVVSELDGVVVGTVGLEAYGRHALLRSLAVSPRRQGQGEGHRLIAGILARALSLGVEELFLLTETAAGFFQTHGFRAIPREQVPEAVKTSVEFTTCCPESAVCMRMDLTPHPPSRGTGGAYPRMDDVVDGTCRPG